MPMIWPRTAETFPCRAGKEAGSREATPRSPSVENEEDWACFQPVKLGIGFDGNRLLAR